MDIEKYATVDDVIKMLQKISKNGRGDYELGCNQEYHFARKGDEPEINDDGKTVDFGGYC